MEYYKVPTKIRSVTEEDLTGLPKGFRFHPTDEEIVFHYLIPKALNSNFRAAAIGQADFNKCEPWDLPRKANMGDTERYYYCQRDRKYPSGLRTNRATKAGYWKATGKDKEIFNGVGAGRELIGMKKTLVFYTGRAPNGVKTNWVMHEFRLHQNGQFSSIPKDDGWVVSRVFYKIITTQTGSGNSPFPQTQEQDSLSFDEAIINNNNIESSLPDLVDHPSSSNLSNSYDYLHQSVNIDVYDDDHQLIYSDDPDYYFPSLSETLHQTIDDCLGHEKSVVQMQDDRSNDHKVEVSFDDFALTSTLGSMPELRKLWDE